jgi:hypothetical protein
MYHSCTGPGRSQRLTLRPSGYLFCFVLFSFVFIPYNTPLRDTTKTSVCFYLNVAWTLEPRTRMGFGGRGGEGGGAPSIQNAIAIGMTGQLASARLNRRCACGTTPPWQSRDSGVMAGVPRTLERNKNEVLSIYSGQPLQSCHGGIPGSMGSTTSKALEDCHVCNSKR